MTRAAALPAVALLALLAACGGGAESASPSTTATTATPTPSPTPSAISREDAGRQYLALVAPLNAAIHDFNVAASARPLRLDPLHKAAASYADANTAFATGLLRDEWPADARETAAKLAAEHAEATPWLRQLAVATSLDQVMALATSTPTTVKGSGSAPLLRIQLGLPEASVTPLPPSPTP